MNPAGKRKAEIDGDAIMSVTDLIVQKALMC